jgi:hypothetical protein
MSLGCALENLIVAARAAGYVPEVTYPDAADFIHVRLTADTPQSSPLFDAIPLRQNTRSDYDSRLVQTADLDQVQVLPLEPGVVLHFVTNPTDMGTVVEYVTQGNLRQYAEKAFVDELIYWLRFNKKKALSAMDGLYSRCSGNPEVPRWLGQMFVAGTKPQQQADADAKKLRSSPAAVVIASEFDVSLKLNPLRCLQHLARRRTLIAVWSGQINDQYLIYAEPTHSEYFCRPFGECLVIDTQKLTLMD